MRDYVMMRAVSILAVSLAWITSSAGAQSGSLRTWKDESGTFEVQASLVRQDGTALCLKREDGKEITVPLERLSASDRQFVTALNRGNPFASPQAGKVGEVAQSFVMVEYTRDRSANLTPGLVYAHVGDRAYVVIPPGAGFFHNPTLGQPPVEEKFVILWGHPQPKRVAARREAAYARSGMMMLSAAAAEMPPALAINNDLRVALRSTVHLVNYSIRSGQPPSFSRDVGTGVVTKVFRAPEGNITEIHLKPDLKGNLQGAVVISESGEFLGRNFSRELAMGQAVVGDTDTTVQVRPPFLEQLGEPEFGPVRFAAKSGDREKVQLQFAVNIADPFRKTREPRLRVREGAAGSSASRNNQPQSAPAPPLADASEVKLVAGLPDEVVARQVRTSGMIVRPENCFVGTLTIKNPGPQREMHMIVQAGYRNADGREVWLQPASSEYKLWDINQLKGNLVPDIPGINGKPLDMPTPVRLADGSLQLTSEMTRYTPTAPPRIDPLPEKAKHENIKGPTREGDYLVRVRHGDRNISAMYRTSGAAFSADGATLYILDGDDTVRKLRSTDLTEELHVKLTVEPTNLALSKAGLLVTSIKEGAVFVLDPQSLKVQRAVAVPYASFIAANPTTPIAFATGILRHSPDSLSSAPTLAMIDVERGQILHMLRSSYASRRHGGHPSRLIDDGPRLKDAWGTLLMSPDGKFLYANSDKIRRFRVEKGDLIYETASQQFSNQSESMPSTLSLDGKRVAVATGQQLYAFDVSDLKSKQPAMNNSEYTGSIAFEPRTGSLFGMGSEKIGIFGKRGEKVTEFPHNSRHQSPFCLVWHPRGEGFVLWTNERVSFYQPQAGAAAR